MDRFSTSYTAHSGRSASRIYRDLFSWKELHKNQVVDGIDMLKTGPIDKVGVVHISNTESFHCDTLIEEAFLGSLVILKAPPYFYG